MRSRRPRDFPARVESFYGTFGPLCEPSHLSLFRPPSSSPKQVLSGQDVISVAVGADEARGGRSDATQDWELIGNKTDATRLGFALNAGVLRASRTPSIGTCVPYSRGERCDGSWRSAAARYFAGSSSIQIRSSSANAPPVGTMTSH